MPQTAIYLSERTHGSGDETPPAVAAHGLARLFAGSPALVDVSLRLERGRMLALHGPNGAGKTTLLRLLATIIRPSFGRLEIEGIDAVRRAEDLRPRLAYLGHAGGLYDDLTLRENLRFAGALRAAGHSPDRSVVDAAIRRVGLAAFADERVRGFSAGMRKRSGLARLLLADARLILLDEPYAGLDEDGMRLVDELLAEWRRRGATCVVASHAAHRLAATADAVATLDGGVLVALSGEGAARTAPPAVDAPRAVLRGAG